MSSIIQGEPAVEADKKFLAGQITVQGKTVKQYLYVPANTEEGEVLVKTYDGDSAKSPKAVAAATSAFNREVVVATQDQGTTAGFQWCVIAGPCYALVDGTTDVAVGNFLEVLNGADGFTKDGTAQATTSAAIALEAVTANEDTLAKVELIAEQNTIAAS